MKSLNVLFAFLRRCSRGCSRRFIICPEKGSDMRAKICKILDEKGIHLKKHDMEELIDQITEED